jgi:uncharacterized membrane protein YbhN (UPF0104 family)
VLATYRWHVLLRRLEPGIRFGGTLRAMLLSNFLGALLPGSLGTDAVRVAAIGRSRSNWTGAAVSTAMDRLVGLLALVMIVLVAIPFSAHQLPVAAPILAWAAAGGLAALGIGLAHRGLARWLTHRLRGLPGLHRSGPRALRAMRRLIRQPNLLGRILSLAVVFQLVRITIAPTAAWSLGIAVPLAAFYVYMPAVLLLMMLPISMGGLGVREMSFVYFFGAGSGLMTPEAALSVSLLLAAATLFMQLPGVVVCFTGVRAENPGATTGEP